MAFARWAARETVKAALVEYATHEAGESFEAFTQKFCSDKTYRQKVLSSPAISPLIAGQSSAEELIVETLGCGYNLGKVNVVLTDVVPENFRTGRAQSCEVKATAYNYSKYHLNNLVVDIDGWKVAVEDLVANAYGDIEIPSYDTGERGKCSNSGQWINEHVKDAGALQCSMPGMAEGDCQELISVSSTIDVEKIRTVEEKALQEEAAKQSAERTARLEEQQKDIASWQNQIAAMETSTSAGAVIVLRKTKGFALWNTNEGLIWKPFDFSSCQMVHVINPSYIASVDQFNPRNSDNIRKAVEMRTKLPRGFVLVEGVGGWFANLARAVDIKDIKPMLAPGPNCSR
jgi:hypothetical protein